MDLSLDGRRVLVGGASRGLGEAAARILTAEGAIVVGISRSEGTPGGAVHHVAADLSDPDGPSAAVHGALEILGGLDGLVVNTGGPASGNFDALDDVAWERAIQGTLLAAIRTIRAALPALREGRDPAIAVVLSSSVREPIPNLVTSNVLRPGLAGLIKSLVTEIAPIRINGVAPGRFDTERVRTLDAARAEASGRNSDDVRADATSRIPLGRYGQPDEFGRVVAVLISPAASYINGSIVQVDGGMIRSLP